MMIPEPKIRYERGGGGSLFSCYVQASGVKAQRSIWAARVAVSPVKLHTPPTACDSIKCGQAFNVNSSSRRLGLASLSLNPSGEEKVMIKWVDIRHRLLFVVRTWAP